MTTDVAKVSENINHRNQVTIDALIKMEHQKANNQKMALEIDKAMVDDPAAAERLAKSRRIMTKEKVVVYAFIVTGITIVLSVAFTSGFWTWLTGVTQ